MELESLGRHRWRRMLRKEKAMAAMARSTISGSPPSVKRSVYRLLSPLVSKSGNRCDAVDIDPPAPSGSPPTIRNKAHGSMLFAGGL